MPSGMMMNEKEMRKRKLSMQRAGMTGTSENMMDQMLFGQSTLARGFQKGLRGGARVVRGAASLARKLKRRYAK